MEYKDILAISGFPGLYKFVAQGKNGVIVESFSDKKRTHISANHKLSSMEDIAVFTSDGEARLVDVFRKIHEMEDGKETIDPRADKKKIFEYFGRVLPEFDRSRVYHSDIKKILAWYNELLKHGLLVFEEEEKKEEEKEKETEKTPEVREKPASMLVKEKGRTPPRAGGAKTGPASGKGKKILGGTKNK